MFRRSRGSERSGGGASTAAETLRPPLYGNLALDRWATGGQSGEPWERFAAARRAYEASDLDTARRIWSDIADTPGLESRQYLQAWTFLREVGRQPPDDLAKKVFGVIAEMPMGQAHDVLAAYHDGSCRYLNHAGGATVIEDPSIESVQIPARAWLEVGQDFARLIGPWEERELPLLPAGHMRAMALTPSGPHFGQGPQQQMMAEAPVKPFIDGATAVLVAVVNLQQQSTDSS